MIKMKADFFTQTQAMLLVKRVLAKLNNTVHCTYGQLFVLHCAADYHRQPPPVEVPPELKIKIPKQKYGLARIFVVVERWCYT